MSEKRRDNRNRILREGEYQRKDGRYRFRYIDEDGKEKTATREWPENGKHKTASFDTRIALGGNVRRINVKAEGATGLVWEPWRTSLDKKDLALGPHIHVKIWGTTLSQKSSCTYED